MSLHLATDTMVADRFRLTRPLGQGGMGSIWMAHHVGLDISCVLKFIHAEAASSPEMRARFEREAKAAAQLHSPHVVQILDHGVWQGTPYIAMEYLDGEDLSKRLKREGQLDARGTVAIVSQIARALSKAHAAGLVHRDLKPANIFLVRDDDREITKVLDFGIAKSNSPTLGVGDGQTKTGSLLGTPLYMSPEQAQGTKDVDHRSDLWSLAVVVFQCITGKLPFRSEALGDLLMQIMVQPIPIPSQIAPVPPGFDAWWVRAVARDPARRFQSAKELADSLAVALGISVTGSMDIGLGRPMFASTPSVEATPPTAPDPLQVSMGDQPTRVLPASRGAAPLIPSPALPHTAGPVVRPVSGAHAVAPAKPLLGIAVGALLAIVVITAAVLFFMMRSPPRQDSTAAPPPALSAEAMSQERMLPSASTSAAEPLPSTTATATPSIPSAAPTRPTSPSTPTANPSSSGHTPPPTSKSAPTPGGKPKPDFGI